MNRLNQKYADSSTEDEGPTQAVRVAMGILCQRRGNECLYRVDFARTERQRGLRIQDAAPHIGIWQESRSILRNFKSLVYEANLLQVRVHISSSLEGFADNPTASQRKCHFIYDFKTQPCAKRRMEHRPKRVQASPRTLRRTRERSGAYGQTRHEAEAKATPNRPK
jgi:hypothetical protein